MIPVRVPADAKPVLASERRMNIRPGHPLYNEPCPVCDGLLGETVTVLVFAGIEPEDRKPAGWTTGGAVAVHAFCAGVPQERPAVSPVTVTFDITDPDDRHALTQALDGYQAKQGALAAEDDSRDRRVNWASAARRFRDRADGAAG